MPCCASRVPEGALDSDDALIGTTEHGVLGHRWIYDATRDPVAQAQLFALLLGTVKPQAQSVNETPDPTVLVTFTGAPEGAAGPAELALVTNAVACSRSTARCGGLPGGGVPNGTASASSAARATMSCTEPSGVAAGGTTTIGLAGGDLEVLV